MATIIPAFPGKNIREGSFFPFAPGANSPIYISEYLHSAQLNIVGQLPWDYRHI